LKSLVSFDKSYLESAVEQLVNSGGIEVVSKYTLSLTGFTLFTHYSYIQSFFQFETAKKNIISDLVGESNNLTKVEEDLTTEYFKTGPILSTDHTVYTRVIEQPALMHILGAKDPFVYTNTLMIMNKEWMDKLPTVDEEIGHVEQTTRLDAFLADNKPKDCAWDKKNLNKYIKNMNESSKTTYGDLGWVQNAK